MGRLLFINICQKTIYETKKQRGSHMREAFYSSKNYIKTIKKQH